MNRFPVSAIFSFILIFLAFSPVVSQSLPLPEPLPGQGDSGIPEDTDRIRIEVLTGDPSPYVWGVWGHTALRVWDPKLNQTFVFNYGVFEFSADFGYRYLVGEPMYRLGVSNWKSTRREHILLNQTVYAQELILPEEKKRLVLDKLYNNIRPQNRFYHYHHYRDNCTTRVRDVVDFALDGAISRQTEGKPADGSYRKWSMEMASRSSLLWLGMNILLNVNADKNIDLWEDMFLPNRLMDGLNRLKENAPEGDIIKEAIGPIHPVLVKTHPQEMRSLTEFWIQNSLLLILYIGIFFIFPTLSPDWLPSRIRKFLNVTGLISYSVFSGLFGSIILILWILSPREIFHWNYNLFAFHPVHLYLPFHALIRHKFSEKWNNYFYGGLMMWPLLGILLDVTNIIGQQIAGFALFAVVVQAILYWQYRNGITNSKDNS